MIRKLLTIIAVAIVALPCLVGARDIQDFNRTEPLEGIEKAEIQLELSLATFKLNVGQPDDLIKFHARYDADRIEPRFRIDRDGVVAHVLIEMDQYRKFRNKSHYRDEELYEAYISPEPDINLSCEVGLGDNEIDLTGIKVKQLRLEAGLAKTDLVLKKPNPVIAKRVDIQTGLGELNTENLGYLRFETLDLEGGLGDVELDLRGFEGEGEVNISIGLGSLYLILPKDVGVDFYYSKSFMSDVDFNGFISKGRHRYQSENYSGKKSHLCINLEIGMGSANIVWR